MDSNILRPQIIKTYQVLFSKISVVYRPAKSYNDTLITLLAEIDNILCKNISVFDKAIELVVKVQNMNFFTVHNNQMSFVIAYIFLRETYTKEIKYTPVEDENKMSKDQIKQIVQSWL